MRAVNRRQQETEPSGFRLGFANTSETEIHAAIRSRPAAMTSLWTGLTLPFSL